jgi:PIN domain nuclease of toxin-antitoxin system
VDLLLDTHTFLWFLSGDARLSFAAREAISEPTNRVYVSAASVWEISTKHRLGKLPGFSSIVGDLDAVISAQDFERLSITTKHGQLAGALSIPHKDPFDRMLVAQATEQRMQLVSNEQIFDQFGVVRLW